MTRTPDRRIRNPLLYPAELRAQNLPVIIWRDARKNPVLSFSNPRHNRRVDISLWNRSVVDPLLQLPNAQGRQKETFCSCEGADGRRARPETGLALGGWGARFGLRVFLHFGTGRAADSLTLR